MTLKEAYKLLHEIGRAIKQARKVNQYLRADHLTHQKKELKKKIVSARTKLYANMANN